MEGPSLERQKSSRKSKEPEQRQNLQSSYRYKHDLEIQFALWPPFQRCLRALDTDSEKNAAILLGSKNPHLAYSKQYC